MLRWGPRAVGRGQIRAKCPVLRGTSTIQCFMLAIMKSFLIHSDGIDDCQIQTATSISCSLCDGHAYSSGSFTGLNLVFQARICENGNDLTNADAHR